MIAEVVIEQPAVAIGTSGTVQRWRLRDAPLQGTLPQLGLSLAEWHDDGTDLLQVDARFHALEEQDFSLRLALGRAEEVATTTQVLTRYQRLLPPPQGAEAVPELESILEAHRALHDLSKPLVRADYDHAHDTWRWLLRLDPTATAAAQLAALFHDVERLGPEGDRRTEHEAKDYGAFKQAHARRGAQLADGVLERAGCELALRQRVCQLIERHEQPSDDPELCCLNDADALSFFSLNAVGYLRYFGVAQTRKKVEFTLRRMREDAAGLVPSLRMPHVVSELVRQALHTRFVRDEGLEPWHQ